MKAKLLCTSQNCVGLGLGLGLGLGSGSGLGLGYLRVDGVRGLAVRERLRVPPLVGAQGAELVVQLGRSRADLHGRDEGRLVARPIEGAPQAERRQVAHLGLGLGLG